MPSCADFGDQRRPVLAGLLAGVADIVIQVAPVKVNEGPCETTSTPHRYPSMSYYLSANSIGNRRQWRSMVGRIDSASIFAERAPHEYVIAGPRRYLPATGRARDVDHLVSIPRQSRGLI
jgi:hypothetical protein